ncbi:hypothetical protein RB213_013503, partial [Colletotrichum asianum]
MPGLGVFFLFCLYLGGGGSGSRSSSRGSRGGGSGSIGGGSSLRGAVGLGLLLGSVGLLI